jgi:hypothetical protein
MRYLIQIFIFLLPLHAILVTYLSCKIWINTNILRFWKEIVVILLLFVVSGKLLLINKFNFKNIYKNNYLLGTVTAFTICSFIYIFFPYFNIKISGFLWFKYDVFFLFTLIIWVYLSTIKENFEVILKTVFISIWLILVIFLPWFMFWDISKMADFFGYSTQVSTYNAGSCIAFAQNVTWGYHRFQWTFWDPIRFSVFLVVFYFIYLGFVLHKELNNKIKMWLLIIIPSLFVLLSIFFALTKTSILWLLFWSILFIYITRKIKYKKEISKKFIISLAWVIWFFWIILLYVKRNLFLHPEAILGRVENLITSINMFFYNPFWYWLWIAWPASQLWTSNNEALSESARKFLPENWYVQILLEQSILWLALFISILIIIWTQLWKIVKIKRDYLSIWIFVAYISILFMWNFTHVFEESATSFILFLIMGAYIAMESREYKN